MPKDIEQCGDPSCAAITSAENKTQTAILKYKRVGGEEDLRALFSRRSMLPAYKGQSIWKREVSMERRGR